MIDYILKETGQPKLSYIGHSLGCGVFFIAMVKHPELNEKIEIMVIFKKIIIIKLTLVHLDSFKLIL
jgi:pimeloyl-ACP methyl ester carboxylesterase